MPDRTILDKADPRIPLVFGSLRNLLPGDAALLEGEALSPGGVLTTRFRLSSPGHSAGCACCQPRTGAAAALALLFLARAKGGQGWFQRVVALGISKPGKEAVSRAMEEDVFVAARFRLGEPGAAAPPHPPGPAGAA